MDVHTINYTLCAMRPIISENDRVFAMIKVTPAYKNSLMFIENLKMKLGLNNEYDIQCGYEAGCLDYSLYNQLAVADETSGGTCKGAVGHNGNKAEVIAYADKANMRLRSRYYKRNVAVAAIARELACFIWDMMTDNIEMKAAQRCIIVICQSRGHAPLWWISLDNQLFKIMGSQAEKAAYCCFFCHNVTIKQSDSIRKGLWSL